MDLLKIENDKLHNRRPKTSSIGQYTQSAKTKDETERQALFGRVVQHGGLEELLAEQERRSLKKVVSITREKDDLIGNKRSRFIDSHLVPPVRDKNSILDIMKDQKKNKKNMLKSHASAASSGKKSSSIFSGGTLDLLSLDDVNSSGDPTLSATDKKKRDKVLRGNSKPIYGAGRVTSSHNLKGAMEYPFL